MEPAVAAGLTRSGLFLDTFGPRAAGSAGKYLNITLRVWDGVAFNSLALFAISVNPPRDKTGHRVTLRWTPPTRNTNGSRLTNLRGYRVLYGMASRHYTHALEVRGPAIRSVEIEGLASGTWYFAVRSVNQTGTLSGLSGEARAVL